MIPTPPTLPRPKIETSDAQDVIERRRQWKYRFAQSLIFGLPIVALHFIGPKLGGPEAPRSVALFEALLAGWVLYVGALGMIGDALVRRGITADGLVALVAMGIYVVGVWRLIASVNEKTPGLSRGFLASAVLIIVWSAIRLVGAGRDYSE